MISEIANSLFLTYLASEYLLSSSTSPPPSSSSRSRTLQRADKDGGIAVNRPKENHENYRVLIFLTILVGIANLVDHHYYLSLVWGYTSKVVPNIDVTSNYVMIPTKLFLAATSYVLALYVDIHRDRSGSGSTKTRPNLPFRSVFLPKVGWAFLKILPAYPFLAVLISFGFLFVVDLWEYVLHLPLEWLNMPIYYGTLYGPFAYVYVHIKREVLHKHSQNDLGAKGYSYENGVSYGYTLGSGPAKITEAMV